MKVIPIAVSVAVRYHFKIVVPLNPRNFSHISGTLLLTSVADVYRYGASVWLYVVAYTIMGFLATYVYLPVFFKMQVTNIYEYLEKRFDKKTRMIGFVFYVLSEIFTFPVHAYTPSLTFATGTTSNMYANKIIVPL